MPLIPDITGENTTELSLKAPTFALPTESAAYSTEGLDWVRVQAWQTNGTTWDSATLKLQASLDRFNWSDLGTTLSSDGITSKVDIKAVPFVRVVKGTDATSDSPVVRVIVYGEVDR